LPAAERSVAIASLFWFFATDKKIGMVSVKNAMFIPIFLSISTFTIPNKLYAAKLIGLKTEYFRSTNSNFREIYGTGAIFGIGARSERDSRLIWGLELEYFSRTGERLGYPAKNSMKGLLVEGPDLSDKMGV
jgi:hypothetical protein